MFGPSSQSTISRPPIMQFALTRRGRAPLRNWLRPFPGWRAARSMAGNLTAPVPTLPEPAGQLLETRKLDADSWLPLALGASIEVHAQVLAARGQRPEALEFLRLQLKLFSGTSLTQRIRKNRSEEHT